MAQVLLTLIFIGIAVWISMKIIDKARKSDPVDDVKEKIQKKEAVDAAEDLAVKSGLTEKPKKKSTKKRKDS